MTSLEVRPGYFFSKMIRQYQANDWPEVARIFLKNVPQFFAEHELADLQKYLQTHHQFYFVFDRGGVIQGAGGYHFPEKNSARISWDFIDPVHQGQGIGRQLVEHSLHQIYNRTDIKMIEVWTSQKACNFYGKFGFRTQRVEPNYWTQGLHLYYMNMQR